MSEQSVKQTQSIILYHARSDIRYIEGLQEHIDSGRELSDQNVNDLIAMVRWNAQQLVYLLEDTDQT